MAKKRIQVSLDADTYRRLKAVAEASEASMSAVCGEVLETTIPALHELTEGIQHLKGMRAEVIQQLEREATTGLQNAARHMNVSLGDLQKFTDRIQELADQETAPTGRGQRTAAAGSLPPLCNTGVSILEREEKQGHSDFEGED